MTESDKVLVSGFAKIVAAAADNDNDTTTTTPPNLAWFCAPDSWKVNTPNQEGYGGQWKRSNDNEVLELYPPMKKDFWRKTYYQPLLVKDDGPVLYTQLPDDNSNSFTVTTRFTLTAQSQFDQAGLVVRLDYEHWIKTGIEVVDGRARLSCVVTNVYSDWSTQPWVQRQAQSTTSANKTVVTCEVDCRIRIHCRGQGNFVVQAQRGNDDDWELVRICHLSRSQVCQPTDPLVSHAAVTAAFQGPAAPDGYMWVGVFACCPIQQPGDSRAVFDEFTVAQGSDFDHTAD